MKLDATFSRRGDSLSRWVGFKVAQQTYAVDIRRVQEVLVSAEIEPVPGAPGAVLGVINLRGRIVTVIDPRRCLGLIEAGATPCGNILILDGAGETLGLRIDGSAEICSLPDSAIKPAPSTRGRAPDPLLRGIVHRGEAMLTLLDADQLARRAVAA